jgi:small subunit ribosomal protein S15
MLAFRFANTFKSLVYTQRVSISKSTIKTSQRELAAKKARLAASGKFKKKVGIVDTILESKRAKVYVPFDTRPLPEGNRLNLPPELVAQSSPLVQAAVSLENATYTEVQAVRIRNHFKELQKHETDTGSSACQIAAMTENIISLTHHLRWHNHDVTAFLKLKERLDKRRKMLSYLRRKDFYTYKAVCEKFGIKETQEAHHKANFRLKQIRLG